VDNLGVISIISKIISKWASRIPNIKTALHLTEGDLGSILFALPLGQLAIMPFSGKLVTRFSSFRVLISGTILYTFSLTNLRFATNAWELSLCLFVLAYSGTCVISPLIPRECIRKCCSGKLL